MSASSPTRQPMQFTVGQIAHFRGNLSPTDAG